MSGRRSVFNLAFVHRKMDGPRTPRDERRRAQHNEGGQRLLFGAMCVVV